MSNNQGSKTATAPTKAKRTPPIVQATVNEPEWLHPITDAQPCGANLEYDTEYAVLLARMAPQANAQYGDFVDEPEAPDWTDVERECRRLLLRSKDITVLIWLARCRARLGGAAGLRDALDMLATTLQRYPDEVHPQLMIEGEVDPAVRANALAALCDPAGLLSDVREIIVSSNTAFRLTVRDVERAFAIPRLTDALPADAVTQQLHALHAQGHDALLALASASKQLQQIGQWSRKTLGDESPDLLVLLKILRLFEVQEEVDASNPTPVAEPQPATVPNVLSAIETTSPSTQLPVQASAVQQPANPFPLPMSHAGEPMGFTGTHTEQREQVRASLRTAKEWLEQYEPSSPVAVLLKQAERLLGKRFAEVAQAIPPDLLAKWEAE